MPQIYKYTLNKQCVFLAKNVKNINLCIVIHKLVDTFRQISPWDILLYKDKVLQLERCRRRLRVASD